MNSANTLIYTPHSLSGFSLLRHQCRLIPLHLSCSFSAPRRRRTHRRKNPRLFSDPSTADPSPDPTLQTVIDLNLLTSHTSSFLQTSHSHLHEFLSSARDAYEDLQTLITLDYDRRLVVSCRRSTVQFVGGLVVCGFVLVFSFSVLYKLSLGFLRRRSGFGNGPVVVRRDRSLGGREVVVGKRVSGESNLRVSGNPLSPALRANVGVSERVPKNRVRALEKKLPKWWPISVSPPGFVMNKQEYQREADRLVRGSPLICCDKNCLPTSIGAPSEEKTAAGGRIGATTVIDGPATSIDLFCTGSIKLETPEVREATSHGSAHSETGSVTFARISRLFAGFGG